VVVSKELPAPYLAYLEQLLERISGDEKSAQSELPEIQKALQEMTPMVGLGILSSVGLPLVARRKWLVSFHLPGILERLFRQ
jgi:hypothetical protein